MPSEPRPDLGNRVLPTCECDPLGEGLDCHPWCGRYCTRCLGRRVVFTGTGGFGNGYQPCPLCAGKDTDHDV